MKLNELINSLRNNPESFAFFYKNNYYTRHQIYTLIEKYKLLLKKIETTQQTSFYIEGAFSPFIFSLFLALQNQNKIVILPSIATEQQNNILIDIVKPSFILSLDKLNPEEIIITKTSNAFQHQMLEKLDLEKSGLVVFFTSGSTGIPKAVVHDFSQLISNRKVSQASTIGMKTITSFSFDHIGGFNVVFDVISKNGCFFIPDEITAKCLTETLYEHKIEHLSASPTFINLLKVAIQQNKYTFNKLKLISLGSEVIPQNTFSFLKHNFQNAKLIQVYGMSETGVAPFRSIASEEWLTPYKNVEYRIRDNYLEIKMTTSMIGYLNYENPFTEDGWLKTGDNAEISPKNGIKILGRQTDFIKVAGEKVSLQKVEDAILKFSGVIDVCCTSKPNEIMGSIIQASIKLEESLSIQSVKIDLIKFLKKSLSRYEIPHVFTVWTDNSLIHNRYKKNRVQKVLNLT